MGAPALPATVTAADLPAFPDVPPLEEAPPGLLDGGHLWLQEHVLSLPLRFRVEDSGLIAFGDGDRSFAPDDVPLPYRLAVRHVRERLDRDALRAAAADVAGIGFLGWATVHLGIDYDWDRLPPVLGVDVRSAERGGLLPPDVTERVFDRLGLDPVNAVAKEVPARDFHPEAYAMPASAWYDGPAAGVLFRNKTGDRAVLPDPALEGRPEPDPEAEVAAVGAVVTDGRVRRLAEALAARGQPVEYDPLVERLVERVARERHAALGAGSGTDSEAALREAVAPQVRSYLAGEGT